MPTILDSRGKSVSDALGNDDNNIIKFFYITGGPGEDRGGSYVMNMDHVLDKEDIKKDISKKFPGSWENYLLHPEVFQGTIRVAVHPNSGTIYLLDEIGTSGVQWWLSKGRGAIRNNSSSSSIKLHEIQKTLETLNTNNTINVQFMHGWPGNENLWKHISDYELVKESINCILKANEIDVILNKIGFSSFPDIPVYELDMESPLPIPVMYLSPISNALFIDYPINADSNDRQPPFGAKIKIQGPCLVAYRKSCPSPHEFTSSICETFITCLGAIVTDLNGTGLPWEADYNKDFDDLRIELGLKLSKYLSGIDWNVNPIKIDREGSVSVNDDVRPSWLLTIENKSLYIAGFADDQYIGGISLFDANPNDLISYFDFITEEDRKLLNNILRQSRKSAVSVGDRNRIRPGSISDFNTIAYRLNYVKDNLLDKCIVSLNKINEELVKIGLSPIDLNKVNSSKDINKILKDINLLIDSEIGKQNPQEIAEVDKKFVNIREVLEECNTVANSLYSIDFLRDLDIIYVASRMPCKDKVCYYTNIQEASQDFDIDFSKVISKEQPIIIAEDINLGSRALIQCDLWGVIITILPQILEIYPDTEEQILLDSRIASSSDGLVSDSKLNDLYCQRKDVFRRYVISSILKSHMQEMVNTKKIFENIDNKYSFNRYNETLVDEKLYTKLASSMRKKSDLFADADPGAGINSWWNKSFKEFGPGSIKGGPSQEGAHDNGFPPSNVVTKPTYEKKKVVTEADYIRMSWNVALKNRQSVERMLEEERRKIN